MIPSRDFFSIQIACKKSKKKSNLIQKIIGQGIQHMFLQVNRKEKKKSDKNNVFTITTEKLLETHTLLPHFHYH